MQLASFNPNPRKFRPFCDKCGWRKGGPDSWDGAACKCGHTEPPIELEGQSRIEADRMWRSPAQRHQFEAETGLSDEGSQEYQERFIQWALMRLGTSSLSRPKLCRAKISPPSNPIYCNLDHEKWCQHVERCSDCPAVTSQLHQTGDQNG